MLPNKQLLIHYDKYTAAIYYLFALLMIIGDIDECINWISGFLNNL